MPILSILLPTWNGARFLREQVASIQAQTLADFELVTCDDGSADETVALMQGFAAADPRIRVLPAQGNLGQRRRLRQLADAATADLVAISDQDDVWASDKLELLHAALGPRDMAFGASPLIDADGQSLGRALLDDLPPPVAAGDRLTYIFRSAVSAHAMLARRTIFAGDALERPGTFDWLLALEAVFGNGIAFEPAAHTFHRMHGGNQMNGIHAVAKRRRILPTAAQLRTRRAHHAEGRIRLTTHLAHLAASSNLAPAVAKTFAAAHALTDRVWDGQGEMRTASNPLRADLAALILPLAGSQTDAAYAEAQLRSLFMDAFHPRRLVRLVRKSLGGAAPGHSP